MAMFDNQDRGLRKSIKNYMKKGIQKINLFSYVVIVISLNLTDSINSSRRFGAILKDERGVSHKLRIHA